MTLSTCLRVLCLLLLMQGISSLFAKDAEVISSSESRLQWNTLPPPPLIAREASFVALDGMPVLAGGRDASGSPVDLLFWLPKGATAWREARLPYALAKAAATVFRGELILAGGSGNSGDSTRVISLRLTKEAPLVRDLPSLPQPVTNAALAATGDRLFLVGVTLGSGPLIQVLSPSNPSASWKPLSAPGGPSSQEFFNPVLSVRWDDLAYRDALVLFTPQAVWRFTPGEPSVWTRLAATPLSWFPRSAIAVGPTHVFVSGEDGRLLAYHTITRSFVSLPSAENLKPGLLAGSSEALWSMDSLGVHGGRILSPTKSLGTLDWVVILVYLAAMIWIGSWFAKDEASAGSYFLGGRQTPWWAAGLSIWATGVSAISFMAIPAKTYATNWHRIAEPIFNVMVLIGGAYLFIPLLRRLNITTVMEHTELRFHASLRLVSTVFMVLTQIGGRMATTLLLPSMALSATTGMDSSTSIIAMGVVTTIYTALGGFKAVIWTDVVQTLLMFAGALITLLLITARVPGGAAGVLEVTRDFDKFRPFDWSPDLTTATVYVFGLWAVGQLFGGISQEFAQRAFSTPSVKAARQSMITAALVSIPGTIIFFATGTALFAYYHTHAGFLNPVLSNDNIVPHFVVQNVPAGVAGLIIAGIFAAAMSTLSGMNSVATVIVQDYYRFSGKISVDAAKVRLARVMTVVCGALATLTALYMAHLEIASLWDNFSRIMSILGGGMAGVGALGMLTTRANTFGVYCSIAAGAVWVLFVAFATRLHFMIYGLTTLVVCFVVGYVASVLWTRFTGHVPRDLSGLTVWTTRKGKEEK